MTCNYQVPIDNLKSKSFLASKRPFLYEAHRGYYIGPMKLLSDSPYNETFSMVSSEAKAITENIFFMSQELLSKTVKSISSPTKNAV